MGEGEKCLAHSGFDADIQGIRKDLNDLKSDNQRSHDKMWESINSIRLRPPVWATAIISLLAGAVGWFAR